MTRLIPFSCRCFAHSATSASSTESGFSVASENPGRKEPCTSESRVEAGAKLNLAVSGGKWGRWCDIVGRIASGNETQSVYIEFWTPFPVYVLHPFLEARSKSWTIKNTLKWHRTFGIWCSNMSPTAGRRGERSHRCVVFVCKTRSARPGRAKSGTPSRHVVDRTEPRAPGLCRAPYRASDCGPGRVQTGHRPSKRLLYGLELARILLSSSQSSLYSLPLAPDARPGQPLAHRHGPAVVSDGAAAGSRSPTGPAAGPGPLTP
jgi:hypothetical protein